MSPDSAPFVPTRNPASGRDPRAPPPLDRDTAVALTGGLAATSGSPPRLVPPREVVSGADYRPAASAAGSSARSRSFSTFEISGQLQQGAAAQVGHRAIEIQILQETLRLLRAGAQARIQRTATAQGQVAATGQMQLTIADAPGRPYRSDNRAGMRRGQQTQGIAHRVEHARVAARFQ